MAEHVTITPRALTVPLTLLVAGFICWATFVTVQLFQIREELAGIKAANRNLALVVPP